jgi:hypothetical protein
LANKQSINWIYSTIRNQLIQSLTYTHIQLGSGTTNWEFTSHFGLSQIAIQYPTWLKAHWISLDHTHTHTLTHRVITLTNPTWDKSNYIITKTYKDSTKIASTSKATPSSRQRTKLANIPCLSFFLLGSLTPSSKSFHINSDTNYYDPIWHPFLSHHQLGTNSLIDLIYTCITIPSWFKVLLVLKID